MRVLFIGGTGVISSGVSPLVVQKGMELYLLNRGQNKELEPPGAKHVVADIRDPASVRRALNGLSFDAVVDWLVFTPAQLEADISLFSGRTSQYIFISSASAYQKPPTHFPITESTPVANPYWQYSRDKIACEERLTREYREKQFPMTIVRPSHTYGLTMIPAGYHSWLHPWTLVDRMRKGRKIIVHGDGTSLWTMTHNTDFAKAFVGLLGNPRAVGHVFQITSDEALTWNQITESIGRAAGVEPRIVHIGSDFISAFDPDARGNLIGDKAQCAIFDNSKIKSFVPGFTATVPFSEGVRWSVEWFEKHPERCTIDEPWNKLADRIIEANETGLRLAKPVELRAEESP
jgi:nucleoside-diphosphate-sugar epimerase